MEPTEVVQFIMGLPKSLSTSTNLESVLEPLHDLAVTGLSDWQASKAYATLTGKKAMCSTMDLVLLVHNELSFVHAGKLATPVSVSAKEDLCMIPQSLDDVLNSPGTAEHSFVWQDGCDATVLMVKRLLDEASQLADQAKRRRLMKDVPFHDEIVGTQVYNAQFRREKDAEKARWDTHVRDRLRLLTTLLLTSADGQRTFSNDPVELLNHAIASLAILPWSITFSRRVAIDRRLHAGKSGTQSVLAETELKRLKNKDTLQQRLRKQSTMSPYHKEKTFSRGHIVDLRRVKAKGNTKVVDTRNLFSQIAHRTN